MSDNPYAAPGEGPSPPALPPPTPTRRVEFRGTLEFEDLWQPPDAWTKAFTKGLMLTIALATLVVLPWVDQLEDLVPDDDWRQRLLTYCGSLVLMTVVSLVLMRAVQAWDRQLGRRRFRAQQVEGWFASEAIEISADGMRQTLGWQAFAGYDMAAVGQPIVWLLRPGSESALPMPRRFFGSEDDWRRFEGLVAGRLPRGGRAAQSKGLTPPPPPLPVGENSVPFSGTLNARHLARARKLLGAQPPPQRMPAFIAVSLLFLGACVVVVRLGSLEALEGLLGVLVLAAMGCLALVFMVWRMRQAEKIELHGVVELEGIRVVEPLAETWFDWESYLERHHDERTTPMVVLLLPENRIHVFPREVFATAEGWQTFLERVEKHVPAAE